MADLSKQSIRKYYPGMDTLRGVAIVMVLIYHNFNILPLAEFGSLGVDLFFVLSGFLITDLLLRSKHNDNFFQNFYLRRIFRIFPVYFLTVFILIFIIPLIFKVAYDVEYYRNNQHWFYMFIQNYLFILKPLEKTSLLNHFWSLAIEEQFYIFWPIVIYFTAKTRRLMYGLLCLFIIVFLARFFIYYLYTRNNLFYIFSRFDGLLVGCILAIFVWQGFTITKRLLAIILIALTLINAAFFLAVIVLKNDISYFPLFGYTTFSLLFGLLAYYSILDKSSAENTSLHVRMLQFFGKISYGLYIYHWPVFVFFFTPVRNIMLKIFHLPYTFTFFLAAVTTTLVSIFLSIISYGYFEKIFLSLKKQYPQ